MGNFKLKFLSAIILISLIISPAFSQENQSVEDIKLPSQKVYPGSISYPIKRSWEKMWEKMPFGSKVALYRDLTLTRAAELDHVVTKKQLADFQTSAERFSYYAGKLTEAAGNSDKEVKEEIKQDFEKYLKHLELLKTNFEYNGSYWMLIEHSINSLRLYSEKLSQ